MRIISRAILGLTLGASALTPVLAQTQDRDRTDRQVPTQAPERRFDGGQREARQAPPERAAQPAPEARSQPQGQDRADRGRGDRGRGDGQGGFNWNRSGQVAPAQQAPAAAQLERGRADQGDRRQWQNDRQGGRQDDRRDSRQDRRDVRDDRRDDRQIDRRDIRDDRRDDRRADRRDWQRGRADNRQDWRADNRGWNGSTNGRRDWSRDWRSDRRYGWQDYRNSNSRIYRMPRYVAPRYGYTYRRWSPGFRIDPWFYGADYWISDPFYYRLPPAYGDYRWVRYYDDVALVDVRTGLIADIIYSFFLR